MLDPFSPRCDVIPWSGNGVAGAIERSNRYREAGADCLFTPRISDMVTIVTLVREIDGPLNMVMGLGNADGNAHEWIAAGVQRVSLGGTFARAALGFLRQSAQELRDKGTISFAEVQIHTPSSPVITPHKNAGEHHGGAGRHARACRTAFPVRLIRRHRDGRTRAANRS